MLPLHQHYLACDLKPRPAPALPQIKTVLRVAADAASASVLRLKLVGFLHGDSKFSTHMLPLYGHVVEAFKQQHSPAHMHTKAHSAFSYSSLCFHLQASS
jgi:hypothetical protein